MSSLQEARARVRLRLRPGAARASRAERGRPLAGRAGPRAAAQHKDTPAQVALARPLLKRYHAHPFAAQTIRCCPNSGEHRELGPDEAAARDLARTVIRAYEHQPVKGAPLCLPGGKVVAADARRAASSRAPPRARATAATFLRSGRTCSTTTSSRFWRPTTPSAACARSRRRSGSSGP